MVRSSDRQLRQGGGHGHRRKVGAGHLCSVRQGALESHSESVAIRARPDIFTQRHCVPAVPRVVPTTVPTLPGLTRVICTVIYR